MAFIDPQFGPDYYSLYGDKLHKDIGYDVVWRRPEQFLGSFAKLFEDGIYFDDVKQGYLGNCWFMSVLSALTERPTFLTTLFDDPIDANKNGQYRIRLCKNGEWLNVFIDDLIPCHLDSGLPVFSKNNGSEL